MRFSESNREIKCALEIRDARPLRMSSAHGIIGLSDEAGDTGFPQCIPWRKSKTIEAEHACFLRPADPDEHTSDKLGNDEIFFFVLAVCKIR